MLRWNVNKQEELQICTHPDEFNIFLYKYDLFLALRIEYEVVSNYVLLMDNKYLNNMASWSERLGQFNVRFNKLLTKTHLPRPK